jgi:hypothetical protein
MPPRVLLLIGSGTLTAVVIAASPARRAPQQAPAAYRAGREIAATTTMVHGVDSNAMRRRTAWRAAGSRQGLLSIGGLPPVPGTIALSGGSLVFRPAEGAGAVAYPLYHAGERDGQPRRLTAVALLEVDHGSGDPVYVFHLDGAVLETASPGVLTDLASAGTQIDSLGQAWATPQVALVNPTDTAGQVRVVRDLAGTPYADSLFRLFGTPARPLGLVGERGQRAGRLGEFVASRDSVSLSPSRMTNEDQLRHALAHELAHRWQHHASDEVDSLWRGVAPIRDSLRYGYRNEGEHQAEAVAFAVHFLQATNSPDLPLDAALDLLGAYERLVPGTAVMARYIVARPLYRYHPLASQLLAPAARVAARAGSSDSVEVF